MFCIRYLSMLTQSAASLLANSSSSLVKNQRNYFLVVKVVSTGSNEIILGSCGKNNNYKMLKVFIFVK